MYNHISNTYWGKYIIALLYKNEAYLWMTTCTGLFLGLWRAYGWGWPLGFHWHPAFIPHWPISTTRKHLWVEFVICSKISPHHFEGNHLVLSAKGPPQNAKMWPLVWPQGPMANGTQCAKGCPVARNTLKGGCWGHRVPWKRGRWGGRKGERRGHSSII